MESRTFFFRSRAAIARIAEDSIEDFDQIKNFHFQTSFLKKFPGDSLLQGLSQFQGSARNGPLSTQRLAAAADQKTAIVVDDHSADADNRTIRIFSRHGSLFSRADSLLHCKSSSGSIH